MKKNEALPSKFLNASDADYADLVLTITEVRMETMGDGKEKPCEFFRERKIVGTRGLVINATNWDILAGMFGDESDDWVGKQITVTTEMVNSPNGGRVPGLRVVDVRQSRPPGTRVNVAHAKAGKGQPAVVENEDADDIPY